MSADRPASYLSGLVAKLGLDEATEKEIAKELAAHLSDSTRDYQLRGLAMEDAQKKAIEKLGNAQEVSSQLRWVHGFGRYSERVWLDALLGSLLPFALILCYTRLQMLIPALKPVSPIGVLALVAIGISVYAFRAAVPAWTVTWLGISHLLILGVVYGVVFLGMKVLELAFLPSHLVALGSACLVALATTYWMARHQVELTLLFLLPLTLPYVVIGYEDVPVSHGLAILPVVGIFTIAFSFFYFLARNQHPVFFASLGFLFYTGLYADILLNSPAPFDATGLTRLLLGAIIYVIPLFVVSSPTYLYLKRRTS